jgi:hypothetical protein
MSQPWDRQSAQTHDMFTDLAYKNAAGGMDLLDYIKSLEKRIERLEAQLNTN